MASPIKNFAKKTTRSRSLTLYPEVKTKRTSDCLIITGTISRTGAKMISHFDPQMSLAKAMTEFEHLWSTCYDSNGQCIFEDNDPMTEEEALAMGISL